MEGMLELIPTDTVTISSISNSSVMIRTEPTTLMPHSKQVGREATHPQPLATLRHRVIRQGILLHQVGTEARGTIEKPVTATLATMGILVILHRQRMATHHLAIHHHLRMGHLQVTGTTIDTPAIEVVAGAGAVVPEVAKVLLANVAVLAVVATKEVRRMEVKRRMTTVEEKARRSRETRWKSGC